MKKRICIISFSPIYRDARVLRQIKYLFPHYDLNIIGYDQPDPDWTLHASVRWHSLGVMGDPDHAKDPGGRGGSCRQPLKERFKRTWLMKSVQPLIAKVVLPIYYLAMASGRIFHSVYEYWYWKQPQHIRAFQLASESACFAIHANDWEALPVAAEAAKIYDAKMVFDAHEYAPLELENRLYWKLVYRPIVLYFIKKYVSQIAASVTVAPIIAERYQKEFGLKPRVVLNAPEKISIPHRKLDFNHIRLVHHGIAVRDRQLEVMIEALRQCDRRFSLHFMLIRNDSKYYDYLNSLAERLVPGRVFFHEPVTPDKIIERIMEFDMGFCFIAPTNYNYLVSLPNKFFEYVMAGMPVCIGPSLSMAEIVRQYGFGIVARSFDPRDIAEILNKVTPEDLVKMQQASRDAAENINSEKEMGKLVELYAQLQ
jgi:glycosyltransferase involved in cell wall biosynthesis